MNLVLEYSAYFHDSRLKDDAVPATLYTCQDRDPDLAIARASDRPCMDHFTSWSLTTLIIARRLIESKPVAAERVPRSWSRRSDPRSPDGPVTMPSLSIKSGARFCVSEWHWQRLVGDHRRGIRFLNLNQLGQSVRWWSRIRIGTRIDQILVTREWARISKLWGWEGSYERLSVPVTVLL